MNKPYIEIFAKGSSAPNPGTGGWGAIIISPLHDNLTYEICGTEENTTNNRMELTSVVRALQSLQQPCRVCLTTDSRYIADPIKLNWLPRWKKDKWLNARSRDIRNVDLWKELDELMMVHEVEWKWSRDKEGNPHIERVEKLSVEAREALRVENNLRAMGARDDDEGGGPLF